MIIIELSGGLGNQMFQYALYLSMKSRGIAVEMDTSLFTIVKKLNEPEILQFPNVHYKVAGLHVVSMMRGYGYCDNIIDRVFHHVFHFKEYKYTEDITLGFQPQIFDWQSELYFNNIRNSVIHEFEFSSETVNYKCDSFNYFKSAIMKSNSVSIHVRRGDYLSKEQLPVYGNICTNEYYCNAVKYIAGTIDNPTYFVFSDDIEWVKNNIDVAGMILVNEKKQWSGIVDLYLISICRYHIIANSSYSWWGAWLGDNDDKLVISPSRWMNSVEQTDMICNDWVRL